MDNSKIKSWFLLFRPWSLTATLIPFLTALAILPPSHGIHRWWIGLVSGIFFQATVNLLNTYGDERSGVDKVPGAYLTTPQVQQGLISMRTLLVVATTCAAIASTLGLALCFYRDGGEWRISAPLLAAGFIGLLGSTNYSTGIKFKYHALGVPFVAFLMGPLEVFVAMCILRPADVLSFTTPLTALLAIPTALLVCVIMHGNDMRDIPTDRAAGIRTPATLFGPKRALIFYWACHLVPYLICATLIGSHGRMFLLPFMALPLTRRTLTAATRKYLECPENPQWRNLERASGAIHTAFGILYAIAIYASMIPQRG
jgi:1,4-dihydroxy-2-naphthoate octaprenyltransferase